MAVKHIGFIHLSAKDILEDRSKTRKQHSSQCTTCGAKLYTSECSNCLDNYKY